MLNTPAAGIYDSSTVGTGKTISVGGLALSGPDSGNYGLASTGVSGAIGIITAVPVDMLGNSYTSNGISVAIRGQAPSSGGNGRAGGSSDATSDTGGADGESSQSDSAAFTVGKSLGGGAQSSNTVLLEGLLRQVTPPPGSATRGVPPYGQIYSSWGNEAFWQ
jgi:hypothetical protein